MFVPFRVLGSLCLHFINMSLRRQTSVQYQVVEDVHGLFQLFTHCCDYRREDLHYAWRVKSGLAEYGADTTSHAADGCSGYRWVGNSFLSVFRNLPHRPGDCIS